MIKRIVKLEIKHENVNDFMLLFKAIKNDIVEFDGCISVDLLNDVNIRNTFFTYSIWKSEKDLNNYRHSLFFKCNWQKAKQLFCKKPIAWSVKEIL